MVEVAAVHGSANASLIAGYGYAGILVAFIARQNPLAIMPVAVLLGGIAASGGMLQRRLDLPDATVLVLQGIAFLLILASETLYGRLQALPARGGLTVTDARLVGRAARRARRRDPREHAVPVREPRRVHHGEERPHQPRARGHPGHGRDDRLRASRTRPAIPGSACSPRAAPAPLLGLLHGLLCSLPRVNDIAVGIALMLFGTGLAFFLGKPYVQPKAPTLPVDSARRVERARRRSAPRCR